MQAREQGVELLHDRPQFRRHPGGRCLVGGKRDPRSALDTHDLLTDRGVHVLAVSDQADGNPGIEKKRERDPGPPVVDRRHGVVDVGSEAHARGDRLASAVEIGACVPGAHDGAGRAQPRYGFKTTRQLRREGDQSRPRSDDHLHFLRAWVGYELPVVCASE